jgi:hypothetical protein
MYVDVNLDTFSVLFNFHDINNYKVNEVKFSVKDQRATRDDQWIQIMMLHHKKCATP